MKSIIYQSCTAIILLMTLVGSAFAQEDPAQFFFHANDRVARALAYKTIWDGPTTGPKIAPGKLIIFIGGDMRDGSLLAIANSVRETAKMVGWNFQVMDCYGITKRRPEAFARATALKPAGIILAGIDASEQKIEIKAATKAKIPVIGWHAAITNGEVDGLFTNIGTDPKEDGQLAALLAVVDSNAKAGVVVFGDSNSEYSATKTNGIVEIIKKCKGCTLLSVEQVSPTDTPAQILERVSALERQYGARWTYVVGTSDHYFDVMATPEGAAILAGSKLQAIAAGDGSIAAYTRIRTKKLQTGTVPEPYSMQAWQIIDEINRAKAGEKPSGYVIASYVVTGQNIAVNGGASNTFDPGNGYKEAYKKIWGR